MRARWAGIVAAGWALAYVLLYVAVVHSQGNAVAWWYVAAVWAATVLASSVVFVRNPRPALVAALVLYAACVLVAVLSLGFLLLPSAVAVVVAIASSSPASAQP